VDILKDVRIVMATRPRGEPRVEDFAFVEEEFVALAAGEVRLRTIYISLDPALRLGMRESTPNFASYSPGQGLGSYSVCEVLESQSAKFAAGDVVWAMCAWRQYPVVPDDRAFAIPPGNVPLSAYLGALGFTGFAAYLGLTDIGKPVSGETVLVSAASGAVGIMAGQIAAMVGARVVGVSSGAKKCAALRNFGFDELIDRTGDDFAGAIDRACPSGIDVFFDNTGGLVQRLVLPRMNIHGRVALCGMIADYASQDDAGPSLLPVLTGRILVQGFNAFDSIHRFAAYQEQAGDWLRDGAIRSSETVIAGFENTPAAFVSLLRGEKTGKMIVQAGADPRA
jgi:NADPH-dependent curcumin reductase CurA